MATKANKGKSKKATAKKKQPAKKKRPAKKKPIKSAKNRRPRKAGARKAVGRAPKISTTAVVLEAAAKSITADTIWARMRAIFGADIQADTPLKAKFLGDKVAALANVINQHPPFANDNLMLMPGNLHGVTSIGDVGAAIIARYKAKGWTVTVDFD